MRLQNRDDLCKIIQVCGLVGVAYGVFIIRLTKLGFHMRDQRNLLHHLALALVSAGVPTATAQVLSTCSQKRDYQEYVGGYRQAQGARHFDPLDSYLTHLRLS